MKYRVKRIKAHVPETAELLRSLHDDCFGDDAPMPDFSHGYWWVVLSAFGEEIAFAGMWEDDTWKRWGYLARVGVLPAHRGNGLQLRLFAAMEKKAKKLGWEGLVSDTTEAQGKYSSNNFIKAGYTLFEPKVKWAFGNSLYWEKWL